MEINTQNRLHIKIFAGLLFALVFGLVFNSQVAIKIYDFLGKLFLNALKMLIVPLILSSIISAILNLPSTKGLGKLGAQTIIYYLTSSLLAIVTGLILVFIIKPGILNGAPVGNLLGLNENSLPQGLELTAGNISDMKDIFLRMIPPNIVSAAAKGQMLGLIFFAILFSISAQTIDTKHKSLLANFSNAIFKSSMKMTEYVMYFAPIGVFALVAKVIAQTGLSSIKPLLSFFITVVLSLGIHMFITLSLILKFFKVSPITHLKNMLPALLTAFSTASSSATLPITLECIETRAKIPNKISAFVLPLGATVNMDGTALYECVAALFIAQAMGIKISFFKALVVLITALITSIGVAGIPAASLVAIAVILNVIGLPVEAIGPILAVDRILDMMRTSVNVFSDSCGAVVIWQINKKRQIN